MKQKILRAILATSIIALVLAATSLPVHAQPTINVRPDKSAYAPGDSGTLTITIFDTPNVGAPLAVRNITVYYPWAGYDTNGKWLPNANITNNFSPPMALATRGATNFSYTTPSFTIPSWWGSGSTIQGGCPRNTSTRFSTTYSACILVGTNETRTGTYDGQDFLISIAQAFYNPSSTSALSTWVPVAELIVLIVATAILAIIMLRLGNPSRKT